MSEVRELAPGEWSVLALLSDAPAHGWALAKEMSRDGEVGRVWAVGRPLVYRALELLESRGLIEPVGSERGRARPEPGALPGDAATAARSSRAGCPSPSTTCARSARSCC